MYTLPKNVYRERKDFSKIKTTVPIPNLIEIQKKSYERFLQMNRLPSEREDAGLQSVFKSVFPISDFRENSSLEFIEYSIGNWECKCGKLQGLHHLRKPCANCGATLIADPYGDREVLCPRCGKPNQARGDVCDICGNTVGLKLKYDVDECQERGMTYAVPLKVTIRLVVWNKDPEADRDLQRHGVGHAALLAFVNVVLQLEANGVAADVADVAAGLVRLAAPGAQDLAVAVGVGNEGRAAVAARLAQVVQPLQLAA